MTPRVDLTFLLRHWTETHPTSSSTITTFLLPVIILAAPSTRSHVDVRRVTVIEGTQINLRCTVSNPHHPIKSKWEFRFPTNNIPADLDFTWLFRNEVIVDSMCRVTDKRDIYSVVQTKGFSCHLKVLTPATFENIGTYESTNCGIFDVVVVSAAPSCASELLKGTSKIEYLESLKEHLDVKRRLRCGSVEDTTIPTTRASVAADTNDSEATTEKNADKKMKTWEIPLEDLDADEFNKSLVFKINCTVRYYYMPSTIESLKIPYKPILLFTPPPSTYVSRDNEVVIKDLHVITGHVVLPPTAEDVSVHACRLLVERNDFHFFRKHTECSVLLRKKVVFSDMMAVSVLSDACYDLWEFIIIGFVLSTITISVMITMFSRCTPVGEESLVEDSESVLELQGKASRRATTISDGSRKRTIIEPTSILPRWKTWIVRPSLIAQPIQVNFKQVMRDLKISMRHMPPGGKGMMALNSASNSDDLSWYFKPN